MVTNNMEHIHRYATITENIDAVVEFCKDCKKRLITKKSKTGRVDNNEWLKEHIGDTAQPTGVTAKVFAKLYGPPKT